MQLALWGNSFCGSISNRCRLLIKSRMFSVLRPVAIKNNGCALHLKTSLSSLACGFSMFSAFKVKSRHLEKGSYGKAFSLAKLSWENNYDTHLWVKRACESKLFNILHAATSISIKFLVCNNWINFRHEKMSVNNKSLNKQIDLPHGQTYDLLR